jgi:RimJ/RimL family protein N-acetyltransferase
MAGTYPEFSSARLRLRRPKAGDAPRLAELAADYDVTRMTGRMPHPYTLQDAVDFIERVCARGPGEDPTFLLECEEGPAGVLGFFTPEGVWSLYGPEIGYWIGRPFWGRGYASEAVGAALGWAERDWRKHLIVAGHFSDNPASGRVLEKAGFLYTGVVEPCFSLARGETAASRRMVRLA